MRRGRWAALAVAAVMAAGLAGSGRTAPTPHNVIIFVADGLRSGIVTPESAPELAALRSEGVDLANSHSLFPTVTTPNASAIATGHRFGDTGDFGNSVFAGEPALPSPATGLIIGLENDAALGLMNERFAGDYLNETSLLEAARKRGYSAAAVGKLGPVAIQDVSARDGKSTVILDDTTGHEGGIAIPAWLPDALKAAGLETAAPGRGDNGRQGTSTVPGTTTANVVQQAWFVGVVAKVLLPRFKAGGKPFVMVFWSRDPDGSQHNQGDSLNSLTPGINGPTGLAGVRNASATLGALRQALKDQGLDGATDILVTADHGFSTISKESAGSASAKARYPDVPAGFLPPGFLALDLGKALNLPVFEPGGEPLENGHPKRGSAILGADPKAPELVIGGNGGADLIWLPKANAKAVARRIVAFLTAQDYTAALFVDDALGPLPGALPLSAIGLKGAALTQRPAIVIGFRSHSTGCAQPELCGVDVADTDLQQGQGGHGTFGRADTHNFMAAVGPSFKTRFRNPAPVSNADVAPTAARILGLPLPPKGRLVGRVIAESLAGAPAPAAASRSTIRSARAPNGFVTVLNLQRYGGKYYVDAGGMPGRTLGLAP